MFGVETFANFGAFEEEGHPFLNTVESGALSEVEGERDIESDGCGEDGVAAEEIDFDLHGVPEPSEDIDVIPSFFGVAARRIIFDADFVVVITIQVWEGFSVEDVFDDGEFRNFFCFERAWVVEDFAVAVSEDIGREPAVESEASSA